MSSYFHEISKVVSQFRSDATDVLELIKKSQTAHAESSVISKVLLFPFTQIPLLIKYAKILKGSIALQGTIIGVLGWFGYQANGKFPLWIYGILFLVWYLASLGYGFFAMQRLTKNNPFFFYKLFQTRQPALYSAFETLASQKESFDKLDEDLSREIQTMDIYQGQAIKAQIQRIVDSFAKEKETLVKDFAKDEAEFKTIVRKMAKAMLNVHEGTTTFEDLNMAKTPCLVFQKVKGGYQKRHDTTDYRIQSFYPEQTLQSQCPFIHVNENYVTSQTVDGDEVEVYSFVLQTKHHEWVVVFFNTEKSEIVSEFFLGYTIPQTTFETILTTILSQQK